MIDVYEARRKAEKLAADCLRGLVRSEPQQWLRDEYLEESNCWLFLKAQGLTFLPQCEESGDVAFVVSKKGKEMSVADHGENKEALAQYLRGVSEYLGRRGE